MVAVAVDWEDASELDAVNEEYMLGVNDPIMLREVIELESNVSRCV